MPRRNLIILPQWQQFWGSLTKENFIYLDFSIFKHKDWTDMSASTSEINGHGASVSCSSIVDHILGRNLRNLLHCQRFWDTMTKENSINLDFSIFSLKMD